MLASTWFNKASSSLFLRVSNRKVSAAISSLAIAAAWPNPTIPGTFKVPERMPPSCPPPLICSVTFTRGLLRLTYSAPTPLGPYILCAVNAIRWIPKSFGATGILPTTWVASLNNKTPFSWQIFPISFIGCTTPVSLLAHIIDTKIVSSLIAFFNSSKFINPDSSTSK